MLRTSILQKSLQSCRYLINHKKPIVESTHWIKVSAIKQTTKIHLPSQISSNSPTHLRLRLPRSWPSKSLRWSGHEWYGNLPIQVWLCINLRYSGQWWYVGALLPKLLVIAFPIWVFHQMYTQSKRRALAGLQGVQSWNHIPEFPHQSKLRLPTLWSLFAI